MSSSLVTRSNHGQIAQMVERGAENPSARGSSPLLTTKRGEHGEVANTSDCESDMRRFKSDCSPLSSPIAKW